MTFNSFRKKTCSDAGDAWHTHTHIYVYTWNWNLKHLFINGCFNWMIPNHYMKDCCFTKHPFNNGCLGYQVYIHHNQVVFWFSDITTRRRDCNFFFWRVSLECITTEIPGKPQKHRRLPLVFLLGEQISGKMAEASLHLARSLFLRKESHKCFRKLSHWPIIRLNRGH